MKDTIYLIVQFTLQFIFSLGQIVFYKVKNICTKYQHFVAKANKLSDSTTSEFYKIKNIGKLFFLTFRILKIFVVCVEFPSGQTGWVQ